MFLIFAFRSLHATFLRNRIAGALRSSTDAPAGAAAERVSQNFVYEHPTLQELAGAIVSLVTEGASFQHRDPTAAVKAMVETYSSHLPKPIYTSDNTASLSISVLLTGSTGGLGSELLSSLLANDVVTRVYALNRKGGKRVRERQSIGFSERAIDLFLLDSPKLVLFEGDIEADNFGLERTSFDEVVVKPLCHLRLLKLNDTVADAQKGYSYRAQW